MQFRAPCLHGLVYLTKQKNDLQRQNLEKAAAFKSAVLASQPCRMEYMPPEVQHRIVSSSAQFTNCLAMITCFVWLRERCCQLAGPSLLVHTNECDLAICGFTPAGALSNWIIVYL